MKCSCLVSNKSYRPFDNTDVMKVCVFCWRSRSVSVNKAMFVLCDTGTVLSAVIHWHLTRSHDVIVSSSSSISRSRQRQGLRWSDACYSKQRAMSWPGDRADKTTPTCIYWQSVERRRLNDSATSRHQSRTELRRIQGTETIAQRITLRRTWHRLLWVPGLFIDALVSFL